MKRIGRTGMTMTTAAIEAAAAAAAGPVRTPVGRRLPPLIERVRPPAVLVPGAVRRLHAVVEAGRGDGLRGTAADGQGRAVTAVRTVTEQHGGGRSRSGGGRSRSGDERSRKSSGNGVGTAVAGHETMVDGHETTVDSHETMVAGHETMVDGHETMVDGHGLAVVSGVGAAVDGSPGRSVNHCGASQRPLSAARPAAPPQAGRPSPAVIRDQGFLFSLPTGFLVSLPSV